MIFCFECNSIELYKINEIVNKFLLAGDKFMSEMHLKQSRFIWNPSNCDCEGDKSCDVGEYLEIKNCKRRKKI